MSNVKISNLTATATLADSDELAVVDKSDTAQAASGSTRKTLLSTLRSWLGKDEDDMASDSATHFPTQQSVKAYVDDETSQLAPLNDPTFTGDLRVESTNPKIHQYDTDGTSGKRHWQMNAVDDRWELRRLNDDGTVITSTPVRVTASSIELGSDGETVTVPAPTGANQPIRTAAAPVSATGYTGRISDSNTGWRIIAQWASGTVTVGSLPATLAPVSGSDGYVMLCRVGNRVRWAVKNVELVSSGTHFTHPTGFRPGVPSAPTGAYATQSEPITLLTSAGTYEVGVVGPYASSGNGWAVAFGGTGGASAGDQIISAFEVYTDDVWPTSLPGTQFTAPATA